MGHDEGNTLKSQDNHEGLRALPWLIDKTQVLYFSSRFLILKNKTSLAALFILLL